jgi:hypothetical protein
VSSAILYLAIVAIWAFLLVPRWIRRSHAASFAGGSSAAGVPPAEPGAPVSDRPDALPAEDEPEADTAPLPAVTASMGMGPAPGASPSAGRAAGGAAGGAQAGAAARSRPAGPSGRPRPAISRSKILQSRRRLLTILILLATAAASCTTLRLTSPWVCIPPAVMLGMYVLLLRETALADAEGAHHQAERAAAAARQRALARSRAAWAARTPQPTAQIIDISARLQDQLYDQYEDATNRAVGD